MHTDIYKHWDSDNMLQKYHDPRAWDKRFRSEKYFLEKYFASGMSALDVGCAAGDLCAGLCEKFADVTYVGIDGAEVLIERGKELFPDTDFRCGNFFDEGIMTVDEQFDMTTATGVYQHEPEMKKLFEKMGAHTKDGGFLLFDVKLFHTHKTLCDMSLSYCDNEHKLYFIVYNIHDFTRFLLSYDWVSSVEVYGYYSGVNEKVRLPDTVQEDVCSAHVFVRKKTGGAQEKAPFPLSFMLPKTFLTVL